MTLMEEREDLLLQNSALEEGFKRKQSEVAALLERLNAQSMETEEAVSLAAHDDGYLVDHGVPSGEQGAFDTALANLGIVLQPAVKEGGGGSEGGYSLLSEAREALAEGGLLVETPSSKCSDILLRYPGWDCTSAAMPPWTPCLGPLGTWCRRPLEGAECCAERRRLSTGKSPRYRPTVDF